MILFVGKRKCLGCGKEFEMRVHQKFCGDWRKKIGCAYKNRLDWMKKWRIEHLEKSKEMARKYRSNNLEKCRAWSRIARTNWYFNLKKNNPEKLKLYNHAHERRVEKAKGKHTLDEWLFLKEKNDNRCLACGKKEGEIILTRDHIIPLIKGGTNYIENIQPLCFSCNSSKQDKIINYAERNSEVVGVNTPYSETNRVFEGSR